MFRSIVVPVDATHESGRALPVAVELAERGGLPLELLTVAPEGASDRLAHQQARVRAEAGTALRCMTRRVLSHDPVGALVEAVDERPDALVVLATSARGPLSELLLGSVSESILRRSRHPLLLVGPRAGARPIGPTVVAAVGALRSGEQLTPVIIEWARCFDAEPWFVQMGAPWTEADSQQWLDASETGLVHQLAEMVRAQSIDAQWDVLHGRDAPDALVDFTTRMGGGIVAVASERWTDPRRIHSTSTARALVHRSPFPVLVVPVEHQLVAS